MGKVGTKPRLGLIDDNDDYLIIARGDLEDTFKVQERHDLSVIVENLDEMEEAGGKFVQDDSIIPY